MKVIALDPSKGQEAGRGDYSAFVMLAVDRQGRLFLEADLARRPTPQIVADGVDLCRRFRPDVFGVEANQYQELLAGEFAAELARQGTGRVGSLDDRKPREQANADSPAWPAALSRRRMLFKSGSPGTRLLVEQLKEFPLADHDDGPDAAEMAMRLAAEWLDRRAARTAWEIDSRFRFD